jgi:hypothetical protein
LVSNTIFTKISQSSSKKWQIPGSGQNSRFQINLEHFLYQKVFEKCPKDIEEARLKELPSVESGITGAPKCLSTVMNYKLLEKRNVYVHISSNCASE